jgi:diguanylate cyclase (GGDEF)-like protein
MALGIGQARNATAIETTNMDEETMKKDALKKMFASSPPTQIWKSRISWRIAASVFLAILTVETSILFITKDAYEASKLNDVRNLGLTAISSILDPKIIDPLAPPFSDEQVTRILTSTNVRGLVVYSNQLDLIRTYGEPTVITLFNNPDLSITHRSADGGSFEVIFRSGELGHPYVMVARLESSSVANDVLNHIKQSILIMLLMSALVTTVLMIALGKWLLEPILFMRNNLIAASKDPEDPKIIPSPFNPRDEIGGAIEIALKLITQNADNMRRIKSAAEDKIHKLAYYDTMTGLPNRTMFLQTLSESARAANDQNGKRFAIVTIDLDQFKDINDYMGHSVGDAILRSVGRRLRTSLPESALVSRSGEDEFAVLMPLSSDINLSRDVAERVQGIIRTEPFKVFNEEFQVRASIGVATYPDDGIEPDQVLKNADIALNRAKEDGRDRIREYSEDFNRAVQQRFQILRDLREALDKKQLTIHYQPQLDLKSGKLIGAEALIRWWKPDNSKNGGVFISPGEFIPVAEQSGLIVPIGEWVMYNACVTAREWYEKYNIDARIAVNVSAAQFIQGNLVNFVKKTLSETGLQPHKLELEVTESVFMEDMTHTIQTLQELHSLGIELAIDDFGTGYSSLSYLRQFPIDRLKIDQSFIRNALNNKDDASIARTIVALGHSLSLKVIAEGVETRDHEKLLMEYGCDEVQGYRYSRPVPNEKFIEFAKSYTGNIDEFNKK